jgi:hypothetical protein
VTVGHTYPVIQRYSSDMAERNLTVFCLRVSYWWQQDDDGTRLLLHQT